MSNQPPQDPLQPQDPGSPGMPQPPAPPYGAPQSGAAPQYGAAPPPPPDYGQTPGGPYAQAATITQPPPIKQAVMLMKVGAGLSLLGLLLSLLTMGSAKDIIRQAGVDAGAPLTDDQLNGLATASIAFAVFAGLVGVGLWLWMAAANGKGRKWARVVSTVFFVLSLLSAASGSVQGRTPALSLVLSLVTVALGASILFLLYKKESTAFYDGMAATRHPR